MWQLTPRESAAACLAGAVAADDEGQGGVGDASLSSQRGDSGAIIEALESELSSEANAGGEHP